MRLCALAFINEKNADNYVATWSASALRKEAETGEGC